MTQTASFWARRRAGVKAEAAAEAAAEETAAEARHQQALAEKGDEEILADLDLPDPETLTKGDDFAAFMSKAVPEHLRKRALRKLWRSNPVLACVDGLNDYDDDYLAGSYGNAPVQTNYQVGKGLLAHLSDVLRPEEVDMDERASLDTEENSGDDDISGDAAAAGGMPAPDAPTEIEQAPQDTDHYRPRRMVFRFDGDVA